MRTIIVLSFALAISSQCSADTRWVTKTTDTDTQGELRYEIWSATPGDVIQFHSDLYGQVVEIDAAIFVEVADEVLAACAAFAVV